MPKLNRPRRFKVSYFHVSLPSINYVFLAFDELATDLVNEKNNYGYFDASTNIGYFFGVQIGKNFGSFSLQYEKNGYNKFKRTTSTGQTLSRSMSEGSFGFTYSTVFGAKKKIKKINEERKNEGLAPISESRKLF